MKIPKKVIASVYRMYERRNIDLPYFRTCMTVVGPLGLSAILILGAFNGQLIGLSGVKSSGDGLLKCIGVGIYFGVLILAFYVLFSKNEILKIDVNERQIRAAKNFVPVLYLIMIICIVIVGIIKGIEKGTIAL